MGGSIAERRLALEDLVHSIKTVFDLQDYVGREIKLTQRGNRAWGCCPFHPEKTPSFSVNPHFFKCFGCGKGGDIVTFYQERHGFERPIEAILGLADEAGIDVSSFQTSDHASVKKRRREVLEAAQTYFRQRLSPEARAYLRDARRLTDATIATWGIGFAPDSFIELRDHLLDKEFSIEELVEQSMVRLCKGAPADSRHPYDYNSFFRNRVMFPIVAETGKLVGFAGRVLDDSTPKFINSTGKTPAGKPTLYRKEEILFGLHQARRAIQQQGEVLLTEGYLDVIQAHQAGITNVVGLCGTALTSTHARLLRRYTPRVVVVMDADRAGIVAAKKNARILFGAGLEYVLCRLPAVKDLDDFVKSESDPTRAVAALPREDLVSFHLNTCGPVDTPEKKWKALKEGADLVNGEEAFGRKVIYIHTFAERLGIPPAAVENTLYAPPQDPLHGAIDLDIPLDLEDVPLLYVGLLLASSRPYARFWAQHIPVECSAFSPALREIYRAIKEDVESDSPQLPLPLRASEANGQRDFLTEEQQDSAFTHLQAIVERKGLEMPPEVLTLFRRPLPSTLDRCGEVLECRLREEKKDALLTDLRRAYGERNFERADAIASELEKVTDYAI